MGRLNQTMGNPGSSFVVCALLLAVTAVWGWTFVVVKGAVEAYGVLSFLALRFTVGTLAMAPFAWRELDRRSARTGAGIGIALAAGYLLQTFGLRDTAPTNSGLITGLFVVFAPIMGRAIFGVRVRPAVWLAVCISLVGLAMLSGAGPDPLRTGDLLTLGCAVCFGLHIAFLARFAKGHSASALALAQFGTGALIFHAARAFAEPFELPTASVWWAIALTGVVATAVAFYIQTYAQQRLSAVRTAVVLTMEPVFAAMFGYLLAGDRLTAIQCAGGGLMVSALLLSELRARAAGSLDRVARPGDDAQGGPASPAA